MRLADRSNLVEPESAYRLDDGASELKRLARVRPGAIYEPRCVQFEARIPQRFLLATPRVGAWPHAVTGSCDSHHFPEGEGYIGTE
jgi:hypothetical protein